MSIEFTTPPMSRRERREREELLMSRGVDAAEAARLAGETGVINLGPVSDQLAAQGQTRYPAPATEPSAPEEALPAASESVERALEETTAAEPGVEPSKPMQAAASSTAAPFGAPMSRRELRELLRASGGATDPEGVSAPLEPAATPAAEAEGAQEAAHGSEREPVATSEPVREVDVKVVEVVEQLFTSENARVELDPGQVPAESLPEGGPLHWTEALSLHVDHDPNDPASTPAVPALVSDTNTIVLDGLPGTTVLNSATGEIDLVVTGSILLPTELTETGALGKLIDTGTADDDADDDDAELSLSHLAPKSAAAAVNANVSAPAMVSETERVRMSVPTIVALSAGGAAGIVLIALGLGALLHLF